MPDAIARDYLLLALRLDQHQPGLVDGYFGPADLKAQVDMEQVRPVSRLRDDALELRDRVGDEIVEPDRQRWLDAQLVALATHAGALAGETLPYVEHVARCFDHVPDRIPDDQIAAAVAALERLLPGDNSLADRIADWDAALTVPPDRLTAIVDWLVGHFRAVAGATFELPAGEHLQVSLVRGQPWSGYNWYEGGSRSRVDLNLDLPIRAPDLLRVLPHETYPGHHLEHATKEQRLVVAAGRLEASVHLINAPECLISEGLADLGVRFAVPPAEEVWLLEETLARAGLPTGPDATDPGARRALAERQVAIGRARYAVGGVPGNAALQLHADGIPRAEVLAYLERWLLVTPERAAKRLSFIEHPLWRTYVFAYFEGERLLRRWLERAPEPAWADRFGRLLAEQLTPGAIRDEIDGA